MTTDTAIQQKIVEIARRHGKSVSNLSTVEFTRFSLMARESFALKANAMARAAGSQIRTRLLGLRVLPDTAASNKAICEACPSGKFTALADKSPSCLACGCSGRFLIGKWVDPSGVCPLNHWSNVGKETISTIPPSSDASAIVKKE